jgi:hypothetical protein
VHGFSEGLAAVESNGKVGFIDRSGHFAIEPRFVAAKRFTEGLARVAVNDGPCAYVENDHFDPCMNVPTSAPATGRMGRPDQKPGPQRKLCQWTFIDKSGRQAFPATFDAALAFHEGLAAVQTGGLWGFIDRKGTFVIPPGYRAANSFNSGVALVSTDLISGSFIDPSGNKRFTRPYFVTGETFSEGLLPVFTREDRQVVYVNSDGKQAFPGIFVAGSRFFHGLAHVKLSESVFAYIDKTGRRVFTYTK